MKKLIQLGVVCLLIAQSLFGYAESAQFPHSVGVVKLIVNDLARTQAFYEKYFGMREVNRYNYDPATFEESIMAFGNGDASAGAQLALFAPNPKAEAPLQKSQFPVILFYTPNYDTVTKRMADAGIAVNHLPSSEGSARIAIAKDPSGNAVEIYARNGATEIGGSKLIVDDRKKAEAFYQRIFGAKSGQVYAADNVYDEVIMQFQPGGAWLALFQPLAEPALQKSRFPLTVFYTSEFAAVVDRLKNEDLAMREVKVPGSDMQIVITNDPAGNAIEIIRR